MHITLRQLSVFDAVARLGSVSAAAKEIAMSQSAATLAIQDLESALHAPLFHRHSRRLTLNENGRRLQPHARSMMLLAAEIEGDARQARLSGALRVGASSTIANYLMPQICARFQAAHPGVRVQMTIASEASLVDQVDELMLDLGFVESESMRQSLHVEPWMEDRLVLVAAPHHWAASKRVDMRQLEGQSWCLQPLGTAARHAFTSLHADVLRTGQIAFESDSPEAIKRAVQSGAGIACLSRLAVRDELARGELAELKVRRLSIARRFNILSRRDVYKGAAISAFLAHAKSLPSRALTSRQG